jgi:hypothetical protein
VLDKFGVRTPFEKGKHSSPINASHSPEGITIRLQPPHVFPKRTPATMLADAALTGRKLARAKVRAPLTETHRHLVAQVQTQHPANPAVVAAQPRMVAMAQLPQPALLPAESRVQQDPVSATGGEVREGVPASNAPLDALSVNGHASPEMQEHTGLIRAASWMSDENDGVRADSAAETTAAFHRQETLFSYGGR